MSRRESSAEIDETASRWALRIDEAALDTGEQADLDTWLQGDVRRLGAFARAQAVLLHVKRAKALGPEFEPSAFGPDAAQTWPAAPETDKIAAIAQEDAPPRHLLTRRRMLLGASAIAAGGAFAIFIPTERVAARIYETGRGEVRLVPLDDGSTITLNTDSRIAVTIDGARRVVQLDRGEALFKVVTADQARFLVEAGDTSLRARKATFTVCRIADRPLEVQVCEGDVDVTRKAFGTRRLQTNMRATMPSGGAIVDRSISAAALQRDLAWQEGMISFEDTPLSHAAAEFARYSDRRIRIADPAVASETVTGLYAANNPEGFAKAVALGLNLRVQSSPTGIIIAR
jgi:transmembrane sensor